MTNGDHMRQESDAEIARRNVSYLSGMYMADLVDDATIGHYSLEAAVQANMDWLAREHVERVRKPEKEVR